MNQVQFNYDDVKGNYDDNKGGVQRERVHFGGRYFDDNDDQQKSDDENDKKKTNTMKMTNKKTRQLQWYLANEKYNGTLVDKI